MELLEVEEASKYTIHDGQLKLKSCTCTWAGKIEAHTMVRWLPAEHIQNDRMRHLVHTVHRHHCKHMQHQH